MRDYAMRRVSRDARRTVTLWRLGEGLLSHARLRNGDGIRDRRMTEEILEVNNHPIDDLCEVERLRRE